MTNILNHCRGGYSNRLYIVKIRPTVIPITNNNNNGETDEKYMVDTVPSTVLVRIYGGKMVVVGSGEPYRTLTEPGEILLFNKLGELGYGPKLFGVFDGGRLEEFIPSHTLSDSDLMDKNIRQDFARKLARYHSIKLPLGTKPVDQYNVISIKHANFIERKDEFLQHPTVKRSKFDAVKIANFDLPSEIAWFKKIHPKIKAPIVFSVNDMNRLNTLVRDQVDQFGHRVTLIDYEFSAMNNRGNDLGGHFGMWILDLNATNDSFRSTLDLPSEDIRREYAEAYLHETSKIRKLDPIIDNVEQLLLEAEFYGMSVMLLFFSWVLDPATNSIGQENGHRFLVS